MTGDVAYSGSKRQYEEFRTHFFNPLLVALGGSDWQGKIYSVPGNHDVDRSIAGLFDRAQALNPSSKLFDPDKGGKNARSQFAPRLKQYRQQMPCHVSGNWITSEAGAFHDLFESHDGRFAIVGINTAWLSRDESDRGQLTPGVHLAEAAIRNASDADLCLVLGHHPLHWLEDGHKQRLSAVLGQAGAIYFHGHMHEADGRRDEAGAMGFLTFQAGAAFQARDGEQWVNGLTWGEIDLGSSRIRLQPRYWNPTNLDWPIASGRFPELLREEGSDWWSWQIPLKSTTATAGASSAVAAAPLGWRVFTSESLQAVDESLDTYAVTRFFDGAEPTWQICRDGRIQPLAVVQSIVQRLSSITDSSKPRVTAVLGPSGEGKSTALRQALIRTLALLPSAALLWRDDDTASLDTASLGPLLRQRRTWIVAADNADLLSTNLHQLAQSLAGAGSPTVHIVFAARDSDWRASGANRLDWRVVSDFEELPVSGLTLHDAESIAASWRNFGSEMLGDARNLQPEAVAQSLFQAARKDSAESEGALLGAMLKVRVGAQLPAHVRSLIQRLGTTRVTSTASLADAFAYVAAMHHAGQTYLSREVLAQALGVSHRDLHMQVLFPLAREAAATGGTFVSTRHRSIADAAVKLLRDDFGVDIGELYVNLAGAAAEARTIEWIPELQKWEFALPAYFARRDPGLAVRIGRRLLSVRPSDLYLATNLGRLYRESGDPEAATALLSRFIDVPIDNRAFWFELGASSGGNEWPSLWLLLAAWSIADQRGVASPTVMHASIVLPGMALSFKTLYERHLAATLLKAQFAAARLALPVAKTGEDKDYLQPFLPPDASAKVVMTGEVVDSLVGDLCAGVVEALKFEPVDPSRYSAVPDPTMMEYKGLSGLVVRANADRYTESCHLGEA